jgi:hypothetical protein
MARAWTNRFQAPYSRANSFAQPKVLNLHGLAINLDGGAALDWPLPFAAGQSAHVLRALRATEAILSCSVAKKRSSVGSVL